MIDPITMSISTYLLPLFIRFFVHLVKNKKNKKKIRAQQASELLAAALNQEWKAAEEWKAYFLQEVQNAKERAAKEDRENEQKWELQEQAQIEAKLEAREKEVKKEKERQAELEREREREFNEKLRLMEESLMRKREGQEQAKMEAALEAREKELKKEQKRWAELEREFNEKWRLMEEKLEREKRERKEGEKKAEMKMKFLAQALQYAFRIFKDLMIRQQFKPCNCGMHPCRCNGSLKQQEREKLLAHFELLEDGSDDDLLNIFGESNTLLKDISGSSKASNVMLLELPEQLPSGFEEDILSMAMTTLLNGPENGQGATFMELDDQLFDDFEDDDIVSSATTNATQAKEKGNAYFKEQKFEEAIKWYSKSIDELPTTVAYCNRAMAYLNLNKFIEVEKDCTEALRIDDRYFKAYARRAIARTKLGCNLEGALVDVQAALELESNNKEMVELYAQLMSLKAATEAKEEGNTHFKDRNFQEAIICYSVSINKSPTVVAYSNRAMAYLKLNKFMEAENDCTKALKIDDQYFKAYARRAIARSKLGCNFEGALKDVELALKLEPDNQEMKELHNELNRVLK